MLSDRSPPPAWGLFVLLLNRPKLAALLLLWGQLLLWGCSYPAYAPTPSYRGHFAPGAASYGVDGQLSPKQFATLKGLAWPQSYDDMRGTFGFPVHRTEMADYYGLTSDPKVWIVVHYSGKTAMTYSVEKKQ